MTISNRRSLDPGTWSSMKSLPWQRWGDVVLVFQGGDLQDHWLRFAHTENNIKRGLTWHVIQKQKKYVSLIDIQRCQLYITFEKQTDLLLAANQLQSRSIYENDQSDKVHNKARQTVRMGIRIYKDNHAPKRGLGNPAAKLQFNQAS